MKISPLLLNPDDFRLGYHPIDEQHAQIIECINELYLARFSGELNIDHVVAKLDDHVDNHLKFEEEMMRSCNYPWMLEHQLDHQKLIIASKDLIARARGGEDVSAELQDFLFSMLRSHFNSIDRKAVTYYLNFIHKIRS